MHRPGVAEWKEERQRVWTKERMKEERRHIAEFKDMSI